MKMNARLSSFQNKVWDSRTNFKRFILKSFGFSLHIITMNPEFEKASVWFPVWKLINPKYERKAFAIYCCENTEKKLFVKASGLEVTCILNGMLSGFIILVSTPVPKIRWF